jgi:hypothetical protein
MPAEERVAEGRPKGPLSAVRGSVLGNKESILIPGGPRQNPTPVSPFEQS